MTRYLSAILSVVALFMFASCSKENGEVVGDNAPSSYMVEYFVVLNSPGTVKITYKDPSGQEGLVRDDHGGGGPELDQVG